MSIIKNFEQEEPKEHTYKTKEGSYTVKYYPEKNIKMPGNYEKTGKEIGALVDEKNAAYGSAFDKAGKVLEILYPDGVPVEKYTDMLTTVRILDKLFRIANNKDAFDEEPWKDIAGYGILETLKHKKK